MAFWDGKFFARPFGVLGTAFLIVGSLAVVDHVMEPSRQLQGVQVFGVRGEYGDLVLAPKLLKEEFSKDGRAEVTLRFAGRKLTVNYFNKNKCDYGQYEIRAARLNGKALAFARMAAGEIRVARRFIEQTRGTAAIEVVLG